MIMTSSAVVANFYCVGLHTSQSVFFERWPYGSIQWRIRTKDVYQWTASSFDSITKTGHGEAKGTWFVIWDLLPEYRQRETMLRCNTPVPQTSMMPFDLREKKQLVTRNIIIIPSGTFAARETMCSSTGYHYIEYYVLFSHTIIWPPRIAPS